MAVHEGMEGSYLQLLIPILVDSLVNEAKCCLKCVGEAFSFRINRYEQMVIYIYLWHCQMYNIMAFNVYLHIENFKIFILWIIQLPPVISFILKVKIYIEFM